jgi:hypothetical protein
MKTLRLALFAKLFGLIMYLIPSDCTKTLKWITKMPLEEV